MSALPYVKVAAAKRQRLSDTICEQIEGLIVDGTLGPGHALPAERVLAAQLGVSRPSLREALLRLEARGLLKVSRRGGFAVTDVSAPTIIDPLVHLLQRHAEAEQDVFELRNGLEQIAAQHAALRATRKDRERLRRCHARMTDRTQERDSLRDAQLDVDFHIAIAEASHNVALIHVMHGIHNLLRTSMRHAWELMHEHPEQVEQLKAQHRAILDAVLASDAPRARKAAHQHLDYVRDMLQQQGRTAPARRRRAAVKRVARLSRRRRA